MTCTRDRIMRNLDNIKNGVFLNKNCDNYWKKVLRHQPNNGEAAYNVGLEYEEGARDYYGRFKSSGKEAYYVKSKKLIKIAYEYMCKACKNGYILAYSVRDRIKNSIDIINKRQDIIEAVSGDKIGGRSGKKRGIDYGLLGTTIVAGIVLLLLALLAFALFFKLFGADSNVYNSIYVIPYVVKEESLMLDDFSGYDIEGIFVADDIKKDMLVDLLVRKITGMYKENKKRPKKVAAMGINSNEVLGVAVWSGGSESIEVYVSEDGSMALSDRQRYELWEATTVLRSALYQYVIKHGVMPCDLRVLADGKPNNFISDIPNDPVFLNNSVVSLLDGSGGWEYNPEEIIAGDVKGAVVSALKPNVFFQAIPFDPLEICVNKAGNCLSLNSGSVQVRSYPVALGELDLTPVGDFCISEKTVVDLENSVYGTRIMRLCGDYAVHGSNNPSSIGKNVTLGCLRMHNEDIEDLYSITPLNTGIKIRDNGGESGEFDGGYSGPGGNDVSPGENGENGGNPVPGSDSGVEEPCKEGSQPAGDGEVNTVPGSESGVEEPNLIKYNSGGDDSGEPAGVKPVYNKSGNDGEKINKVDFVLLG